MIYTANAGESPQMKLHNVTKNRVSFPSKEAAITLLYLALHNASEQRHPVQGWREAMSQFG
jgi:transposase-like protein